MSAALKWTLVVVALVVSIIWAEQRFAAKHGGDSAKRDQGIALTKSGEKQLARVDTIYKRDTVRLTKEVAKYKVLRDTARITDTVWVKAFVQQSDSTIKACTETVLTCEQKDSAHKVIEAGLRIQNEANKRLIPTKIEKITTAAKWLLTGAVIGLAAHR